MATITTTYLGDLRTESTHVQSGTKLITDAPTDNQGRGESFSPTDLFVTSLSVCALTIMGIAARTSNIDIKNTKIETTKIMGTNPRRVTEIIIDIYPPQKNYSIREKRILENAVKTCPVAYSINPEIKETINFHY
ncbi:MAG: OsmC family protein [Candidatus Peregrinibacteria bacterium GW2011_GWF2_33_10]|nr:MAG: OsmC family protein [Candidatus Peregrinibacteria bacterium GW2011_GWF2_33_10]OGJ44514.1 MAG: osmotically inducible protein OsmC [Candidatus Peregrinibacteria bacterium RIFOXYA2_FULL_33_21]OGJ46750.1 MAG: osmotically inducible protein OsmC [Candidatus Peregrinibacteria bacterium RIFOXYA12_FULL_33_12]OGJ50322.1 MAG: osmotically inducible protein OsmC [Candidatus Peregrinibacteria bacterium RIFOXYB2_FULL_33_20]